MTSLAHEQGSARVGDASWEASVRLELAAARRDHADIKVALGRLRVRDDKVRLAELLWPALVTKFEREFGDDSQPGTPVFRVIEKVHDLVGQLSSGSFALARSVSPPNPGGTSAATTQS